MKFDWKAALPVVEFHPKILFSIKKSIFFVVGQHWCKATFFKISRVKLQKLLKPCWPSKTESWVAWVTCWNTFVTIATHSEIRLDDMAKSTRKNEFHPCGVFLTRAQLGTQIGTSCDRISCSPVIARINLGT